MKFLVFYISCGALAALSQVFATPDSGIPMIGASGAISGVLGAYFLLYPKAKVTTLILIFIRKLHARIFLAVWFLFQVGYSIALGPEAGVAWYAHIGGFICGMILLRPFTKKPKRAR